MNEREILIKYLESLGCKIELATMKKDIKQFGYKAEQEVIAIDMHVISINQFEDFARLWCKIIKPRVLEELAQNDTETNVNDTFIIEEKRKAK